MPVSLLFPLTHRDSSSKTVFQTVFESHLGEDADLDKDRQPHRRPQLSHHLCATQANDAVLVTEAVERHRRKSQQQMEWKKMTKAVS